MFVIPRKELDFSYRYCSLQESKEVVVEVNFNLKKADENLIRSKIEDYLRWRRNTQSIKLPNAGSVFKNPKNDSAGRLIDQAGLKGERLGDAQVSTVHANFIVNLGAASAKDVKGLILLIQARVKEEFGIQLSPEIRIVAGR